MTYKPTKDWLILKPEESEEVSAGGIFIPEQARQTLNEGEIIAKGPETSSEFSIGMRVVFTQHSEFKIKVEGEMLLLVQAENVILCKSTIPIVWPPLEIDRKLL